MGPDIKQNDNSRISKIRAIGLALGRTATVAAIAAYAVLPMAEGVLNHDSVNAPSAIRRGNMFVFQQRYGTRSTSAPPPKQDDAQKQEEENKLQNILPRAPNAAAIRSSTPHLQAQEAISGTWISIGLAAAALAGYWRYKNKLKQKKAKITRKSNKEYGGELTSEVDRMYQNSLFKNNDATFRKDLEARIKKKAEADVMEHPEQIEQARAGKGGLTDKHGRAIEIDNPAARKLAVEKRVEEIRTDILEAANDRLFGQKKTEFDNLMASQPKEAQSTINRTAVPDDIRGAVQYGLDEVLGVTPDKKFDVSRYPGAIENMEQAAEKLHDFSADPAILGKNLAQIGQAIKSVSKKAWRGFSKFYLRSTLTNAKQREVVNRAASEHNRFWELQESKGRIDGKQRAQIEKSPAQWEKYVSAENKAAIAKEYAGWWQQHGKGMTHVGYTVLAAAIAIGAYYGITALVSSDDKPITSKSPTIEKARGQNLPSSGGTAQQTGQAQAIDTNSPEWMLKNGFTEYGSTDTYRRFIRKKGSLSQKSQSYDMDFLYEKEGYNRQLCFDQPNGGLTHSELMKMPFVGIHTSYDAAQKKDVPVFAYGVFQNEEIKDITPQVGQKYHLSMTINPETATYDVNVSAANNAQVSITNLRLPSSYKKAMDNPANYAIYEVRMIPKTQ